MNAKSASFTSIFSLFWAFLRLGLTSFGGPVAHLGYFHDEFVIRRKWVEAAVYADLIALCQFLPGPASSQVGIAIGMMRGGVIGALAAWLGFTLPSALIMILFGISLISLGDQLPSSAIQGLKLVAVAVVGKAIWDMSKSLAPDRERMTLALAAAALVLFWSNPLAQVAVIVIGGLIGIGFLKEDENGEFGVVSKKPLSKKLGIVSLVLFGLLLFGLPLLAAYINSHEIAFIDAFYRTGSLVFGGGHVVLPLIQESIVDPGWVSEESFLAGYGVAQALPGPLFSISAFLGFSASDFPNGLSGAIIALLAIYVPSFLLVWGLLPFWSRLRAVPWLRKALVGINAAVVGLLIAAFYEPVFSSSIRTPIDAALGLATLALLTLWKVPPWLLVLFAIAGGFIFASFPL